MREVYYLIDPMFRAARCDIWRQVSSPFIPSHTCFTPHFAHTQAVLFIHGGLYLDIDAYIQHPLDDFIYANDSFIYSYEKSMEGLKKNKSACFYSLLYSSKWIRFAYYEFFYLSLDFSVCSSRSIFLEQAFRINTERIIIWVMC